MRSTPLRTVALAATMAWGLTGALWAQNALTYRPSILPAPAKMDVGTSAVLRSGGIEVTAPTSLKNEQALVEAWWLSSRLLCSEGGKNKGLQAKLSVDPSLPREGYRLAWKSNKLELAGGSSAGVFYGIQTLKQTVSLDPAEA